MEKILETLQERSSVEDFGPIRSAFKQQPAKLSSLIWMEESGGEPAIVSNDPIDQTIWIMDTSKESPIGRRSLCYDE